MRAAVASIATALAAATPTAAWACSWSFMPPRLVELPGGQPAHAPVLLGGGPGSGFFYGELRNQPPGLEAPSGALVSTDARVLILPNLDLLAVLSPDAPLLAGEPYTYWVQDLSFSGAWLEVAALSPVARPAAGPVGVPGPLTWYDARITGTIRDSCIGSFREVVTVFADAPSAGTPPYYALTLRDAAGETYEAAILPGADGGAAGTFHVPEHIDVECVELRAVGEDGERGPASSTCHPARCAVVEDSWPYQGPTWEEVPDGCNLVCTPGAESGYRCEERAGLAGDPDGLAASAGCGCDAAGADGSFATALLALLLFTRRRA